MPCTPFERLRPLALTRSGSIRRNIVGYDAAFRKKVPVRLIPPGFSRRLDVGVNLSSPERQLRSVGFMGQLDLRPAGIPALVRSTLEGQLAETFGVWTDAALRSFLERYPLQISLHKYQTCCPHDEHERSAMEAFRLASLLSNNACVISTPAAEEDQQLWDGLVHYAELNETGEALARLFDSNEKVLDCQLQAGRLYRERFNVHRMMTASGFFDAWHP
mmetsp:Transcript_2136/g.7128  ORF Transcript_2136/g.7128 Transcript_2136/m.7128 type:complete len:218 (+) Transcript_2136:525-1178(+)